MKFIYIDNTIYNENLSLQPIPVHRVKNSFNIFVIGIPVELAVCFHILLLVRLCQISTTSVPGFPSDVVSGFRIADALDIHNGKHLAGS